MLDAKFLELLHRDVLAAERDLHLGAAQLGAFEELGVLRGREQRVERLRRLVRTVGIELDRGQVRERLVLQGRRGARVLGKPGETGLWIDALKAKKGSGQPLTMPPSIWAALLNSNGWATEWPRGTAH